MSRKLIYGLTATIILSLIVAGCGSDKPSAPAESSQSEVVVSRDTLDPDTTPFTNVASTALKNGFEIWNGRPGVAVFDYDRDGDLDFYITAEVRAGSSCRSMDSIDLEFGLGAATVIDEIEILWPSGRNQTLTDVPADEVLIITEPEG